MGLNAKLLAISLPGVGKTTDLRLDPHYYALQTAMHALMVEVKQCIPIRQPLFPCISNGINLSNAAYDTDADSDGDYLYASVAALSQFALQPRRCEPLKLPSHYNYSVDLDEVAMTENEVLLTRSGTPGIAWPSTADKPPDAQIIPSGFVIRITCDPAIAIPAYVAAMLNHPIWRLWTSSLAAGKRQRNLSQEHIASIMLPTIASAAQEEIATTYLEMLRDMATTIAEDEKLQDLCDVILKPITIEFPSFTPQPFSCDEITLSKCGISPVLRMDARYHRREVQSMVSLLKSTPCESLAALLSSDLVKNKQPYIVQDDDGDAMARVVATSSIQAGQVVYEETKPTTDEEVERAGARALRAGDLLVTMDGEGSIGKAAVFLDDYPAVPDSHVGVLRLREGIDAHAIASFLNSSLGQTQFYLHTSGSTGQTQISKTDLLQIQVPRSVLEHGNDIGTEYSRQLRLYEPAPARARRILCYHAAHTSEVLLRCDALELAESAVAETLCDGPQLFALLKLLTPGMF